MSVWRRLVVGLSTMLGAQLEMLRRNRAQGLPRPSTWGAFVLEGAWW